MKPMDAGFIFYYRSIRFEKPIRLMLCVELINKKGDRKTMLKYIKLTSSHHLSLIESVIQTEFHNIMQYLNELKISILIRIKCYTW